MLESALAIRIIKPIIRRLFSTSQNQGAALIEQHLQLPFPDKPLAVDLSNPRNTEILAKTNWLARWNIDLTNLDPNKTSGDKPIGYWQPDFNIYFNLAGAQDEEARLTVEIHENAHPLLAFLNRKTIKACRLDIPPKVSQYANGIAMAVNHRTSLYRFRNFSFTQQELSERVVPNCFHEGFALWTETEVLNRLHTSNERRLQAAHYQALQRRGYSINPDYLAYDLRSLAEIYDKYDPKQYDGTYYYAIGVLDAESDLIQNEPLGYPFVFFAILELRRAGYTLPQAVYKLAQHPPANLSQLGDPISFVRGIGQLK